MRLESSPKMKVRRDRKFGAWVRCIYLKSAELTAWPALARARVSPWTYNVYRR